LKLKYREMNNLTALIIDDESLARFTIRNKLADFPEIEIIGEAVSLKEAEEKIKLLNPALLFLDIQLPDGSGFDLFNLIEYTGKVIFVTAYDEYALRAFEINAIDYLLKPVSAKRLKMAIEKLGESLDASLIRIIKLNYNDRLMVQYNKSVNFIKISRITHITASGEYSYVHTNDGREFITSKSLNEWEKRLPDQNFCRIHRATIINFDYIVKIDSAITGTAELALQGLSNHLKISRSYFRKLKGRYSL
jgi:two-component system, LytTR family, response regulator